MTYFKRRQFQFSGILILLMLILMISFGILVNRKIAIYPFVTHTEARQAARNSGLLVLGNVFVSMGSTMVVPWLMLSLVRIWEIPTKAQWVVRRSRQANYRKNLSIEILLVIIFTVVFVEAGLLSQIGMSSFEYVRGNERRFLFMLLNTTFALLSLVMLITQVWSILRYLTGRDDLAFFLTGVLISSSEFWLTDRINIYDNLYQYLVAIYPAWGYRSNPQFERNLQINTLWLFLISLCLGILAYVLNMKRNVMR